MVAAREWAVRLAHVVSTERAELLAAVRGAFHFPPDGVLQIDLDDRPVGVGGVDVRFADGVVRRADVEAVLGAGTPLPRTAAHDPRRELHLVDVPPGAPHRCDVVAEYGVEPGDDGVRGVRLRVDAARPLAGTDADTVPGSRGPSRRHGFEPRRGDRGAGR
jgi:hypothetical protein